MVLVACNTLCRFLFCNHIHYPDAFLKKLRGFCYRLCPSVCPLCYLLLNHLTKFNQIWCVSYSHKRGAQRIFLAPHPGALGRGQKVKYHLISITKSISKFFIPNFVCVLTNERYKTYQTGFLSCRLGHAPGVGLGAKIKFRPAVCPLCYHLLNHWTKFNQIWCELLTCMGRAT